MKAMILDDHPHILLVLVRTLHQRGYEIMTYSNPTLCPIYTGEGCSCLTSKTCPHIIISDFDMPHVNGMEFLEAIRKKGCKGSHLALISGSSISETMMKRMSKLGIKFIAKPNIMEPIKVWLDEIELPPCPEKTGEPRIAHIVHKDAAYAKAHFTANSTATPPPTIRLNPQKGIHHLHHEDNRK